MLVVAVIAGENIALDSSARSFWGAIEESLPFHFQGVGPLNGTAALRANLQSVAGFGEVVAFLPLPIRAYSGGVPKDFELRLVYPDFERAFPYVEYRGSLVLGGANVTVTARVAEEAGVVVGGDLPLNLTVALPGSNGTFTPFAFPYTFRVASILETAAPEGDLFGIGSLLDPQEIYVDAGWVDALLVSWNITLPPGVSLTGEAFYIGWLDTASLVDPYDVDASKAQVRRVVRSIERIAVSHEVQITSLVVALPCGGGGSALEMALDCYGTINTVLRIAFLMISLPVVVLGLYLGIIGVDLGMAERRREIGLLKSRGASRRQVFQALLVEAILLAVVASVGGLLLGLVVSQVFLSLSPFAVFSSGGAPLEFAISTTTVALAAGFAFVFQLFAAFRPFQRAAALTVTEGLSHYTPGEVTLEYSPTRDITYVLLGTVVFVYQVLLSGGEGILRFLLTLVFGVLTLFAPFLLALGATRLLTRAYPRIYEVAARTAKPFTGILYPLVHRNLARNPRRAGNIATIMSLALVFSLMITTLYASQVAFQEKAVRADIGGDIRIDIRGGGTNLSDITAVAGVGPVARVRSLDQFPYTIIAFDAANYTAIVPRDDSFIVSGGWEAVGSVRARNRVLVSEAVVEEQALGMGEILPVDAEWLGGAPGELVNLLVVGVVRALPGLHLNGLAFSSSGAQFLYLDESNIVDPVSIQPHLQAVWFLVKARSGVGVSALGATLAAVNESGWRVRVADEEVAAARNDPGTAAIIKLMGMQIAFCILIVTAGLGLILYTASLERKAEFAGMVARGASRRQVASILLGEAWVIVVIGLLIGTTLGTATGWVFLLTFTRNVDSLLPPTLAFGWESVAVILATVASMLLTAAVIAWRAGKPGVVDVLRERGG